MTDWHAQVTLTAGLSPEQQGDLHEALPRFAVITYRADTQRATVALPITADTLGQATRQALDEVETAARQIVGQAQLDSVRVLAEDEYREEIERPSRMDLIGATEGAQLLGISRQQFEGLAGRHPDFPPPVAELARGKVYTRESIRLFDSRWTRKKTGRPPKESA